MASRGSSWARLLVSPNVLAAGSGQVERHRLTEPPLGHAGRHPVDPELDDIWANGMLQLRVNTSLRSPPHTLPL